MKIPLRRFRERVDNLVERFSFVKYNFWYCLAVDLGNLYSSKEVNRKVSDVRWRIKSGIRLLGID